MQFVKPFWVTDMKMRLRMYRTGTIKAKPTQEGNVELECKPVLALLGLKTCLSPSAVRSDTALSAKSTCISKFNCHTPITSVV